MFQVMIVLTDGLVHQLAADVSQGQGPQSQDQRTNPCVLVAGLTEAKGAQWTGVTTVDARQM